MLVSDTSGPVLFTFFIFCRNVVKEVSGAEAADAIRILYGGSVKPSTIEEQMSQSDIDGALIGGASLKADSFNEIIANTMKVATHA